MTTIEASGKVWPSATRIGSSNTLSAQMSGSFVSWQSVIGIVESGLCANGGGGEVAAVQLLNHELT
jgi:hypothetical protein